MRILDENSDKSVANIILYLTMSEAEELRDSLDSILIKPLNNHAHVTSKDFQKEITICIYNEEDINNFDKRSIKLIETDE